MLNFFYKYEGNRKKPDLQGISELVEIEEIDWSDGSLRFRKKILLRSINI